MKLLNILLILPFICPFGFAQDTDVDALLVSDVNADGIVNILDLTYVASHFGNTVSNDQQPNPDVNDDGVVNILDLTWVANHFGKYSGIPLKLTDKTFDNVVENQELPIMVEFKSDY